MAIPSKSITRQIRSFPQGINSYVDPLLLPRTQLSFASNATFRGNFATQRPNYLQFSFVDTNGGTDLAAFQAGLFQGSAYYRTGNNGYLMVSVNGYLFQITPNFTTNVATVKKIVTPSQNSTTAVQNWLWQSEEYLIYSDGVNLPIFWNGSTSRRSLGSNLTQLGIVNSSFNAPAIGQYVNPAVSLVAAYTGPAPAVVLIGGAQYEITGSNSGIAGTTATLFLDQVSGSGGASDYIQPGTGVYISSAYAGVVSQASQADFPPEPVTGTSGTQFTVNVLLPSSPQAGNVAMGTAVYDSAQYCGTITNANSGTIASLGGAISVFPTITYPSFTITCTAANGSPLAPNGAAVTVYQYTGAAQGIKIWSGIISTSATWNGLNGTLIGEITSVTTPNYTGLLTTPNSLQVFYGSYNYKVVSITPNPSPAASGTVPFVLTFSKIFQGAIGDVLSIPVTGQSFSTVSVTVQSFSGQEVQVVLPSSFNTAGVGIPIGNTVPVTDTTQAGSTPVQFGTTFSTSPAVGSTIQVIMTQATGTVLVAGQTVYFTAGVAGGGTQLIVGVILASQNNAPSLTNPSNGTFGAAPNQFTLTLSQPFAGNAGDAMQIGSGGTLAQFTVDSITSRAGGVIVCHMTNNYQGVIPIVLPDAANTADLVIDVTQKNQTGGPLLTLVGTYPVSAPAGAITTGSLTSITGLLTQTAIVQALPNYVVQIAVTTTKAGGTPTAGSPDLFVVASTTSGGSGTTPTVNLFNINATPQSQVSAGTSIYAIPELPQCRMGAYGMARNWVAVTDGITCNSFVASDIVGSSSGTPPDYLDAVLKVSQNFDLANGLTFQISGAGEEIVAMAFLAQLNVALGQGPLNIFTDDSVINCQAPTDATTWSQLTSPIITSGLIGSGGISQDAVVQENADLIFRLAGGGVQSVETATIGFSQWGNTPISNEIIRVIAGDPVNLLPFTSIVVFNNRLLMSCQFSQQTRGVIGSAIAVLNFDSISTLQGKQPSIWEGQWTGLNVLQFVTGFFNGSEQCFALTLNNGKIGLSQILLDTAATLDNGNAPVAWEFETGMVFDPKSETPESRSYKRLIDGEFSLSQIVSNVTVAAYYKPDQYDDQNSGWVPWYTTNIIYGGASDTGFRSRLGLGEPSPKVFDATNNRPLREAYDFQVKFVITGSCKFIVGRFEAVEIPEPAFAQPGKG